MKEQFYHTYKKEDEFFVEGPVYKSNIKNAINTSSIDTSAFDKFRQGVEVTQIKHFDTALCVPGAGNPGHYMGMLNFGSDRVRGGKDFFVDQQKFEPTKYIESLPEIYVQLTNPISYVIDSDIVDNVAYDGAIEPLTIRAKSTFSSTDFPHESHDVRGCFMGGSADQFNSSCQILTVDQRKISTQFVPYLDAVDTYENAIPITGYIIFDKADIFPFDESVSSRHSHLFSGSYKYSSDMYSAMLNMSPESESYISHLQVSSTSGWDYDNNVTIGTDSIAFGGMTYL